MKFSCGLTEEEKAAERAGWEEERKRLADWHRHFAWWPVPVGIKDCRWLEVVERKYGVVMIDRYGLYYRFPEYRAL